MGLRNEYLKNKGAAAPMLQLANFLTLGKAVRSVAAEPFQQRKMNQLLIVFLLFTVFVGCKNEEPIKVEEVAPPIPVFAPFDTSGIVKVELPFSLGLIGELIYLGKEMDTIYPSRIPFSIEGPSIIGEEGAINSGEGLNGDFDNYTMSYYPENDTNYVGIDYAKLSLLIDTNQLIYHRRYNSLCYPVIIRNKGSQNVILGNEISFTYISMEAELTQSKWTEIFPAIGLSCGVGVDRFKLPSEEIAVVIVPKLNGETKVKCRYKLVNFYSNEVYQFIDTNAFRHAFRY